MPDAKSPKYMPPKRCEKCKKPGKIHTADMQETSTGVWEIVAHHMHCRKCFHNDGSPLLPQVINEHGQNLHDLKPRMPGADDEDDAQEQPAMPVADVADDDVAQAILAQWKAFPALDSQYVPGSLQRDKLSAYQAGVDPPVARRVPYAQLVVKKASPGLHAVKGSAFLDIRQATIKIYGLHDDVAAAIGFIRDDAIFNQQVLSTQARFVACLQEEDELEPDPSKKQGEDVYVGTIVLMVWTQRSE